MKKNPNFCCILLQPRVTKQSSFSVRKKNVHIEQKEPDLSFQYRYSLCRLLFRKNKFKKKSFKRAYQTPKCQKKEKKKRRINSILETCFNSMCSFSETTVHNPFQLLQITAYIVILFLSAVSSLCQT